MAAPDAGRVATPKLMRRGFLQQEIDPRREHSVRDEASSALAHLDVLEAEIDALQREVHAWQQPRNTQSTVVDWRFTTDDARGSLKTLYPPIME